MKLSYRLPPGTGELDLSRGVRDKLNSCLVARRHLVNETIFSDIRDYAKKIKWDL
jgi:hypothetical protein